MLLCTRKREISDMFANSIKRIVCFCISMCPDLFLICMNSESRVSKYSKNAHNKKRVPFWNSSALK